MLSKDVSCLESIESVQREKELDFPGRVGSMIQRMFSTHEMTLLAARRELSSRRLHQYYSECIGFYVVDARMSSSGHGPGRRHHSNTRAGCVILNLNNSRPFDSIHFPFSLSLGRPFGRSFGPMKSKQLFVTFYVPSLLVFFSHTSPIQGRKSSG